MKASRRRVFCASLADVFDNEAPPAWRAELLALISGTPNLDWLLLTKRIGNVAKRAFDIVATLKAQAEHVFDRIIRTDQKHVDIDGFGRLVVDAEDELISSRQNGNGRTFDLSRRTGVRSLLFKPEAHFAAVEFGKFRQLRQAGRPEHGDEILPQL